MTDLNNSVIMPREDFVALQSVAWDHSYDPTIGARAAQVVQTSLILTAATAAVVVMTWSWVKAKDWVNKKDYERAINELQFRVDNNLTNIA